MSSTKVKENGSISLLFFLTWSGLPALCYGYVNWVYPDADTMGLTFNYIDSVYFSWTSNITEPWMNLWCAPSQTSPQSKTQAYHAPVSTNGTNPQSFPYSEYYNDGLCHMQIEDFAGDDWANTPTFDITSNDAVTAQTWGLSAISLLGGGMEPTTTPLPSTTEASSSAAAVILSSSPSISSTSTAYTTITFSSSPSSSSSLSFSSSSSSFSSPLSTSLQSTSTQSPSVAMTRGLASPAVSSSPTSPPKPLSTAAKAGISIGCIFCALTLMITMLLVRIVWSRRTRGGKQDLYKDQSAAEADGGAFYEISATADPKELYGTPRAELEDTRD